MSILSSRRAPFLGALFLVVIGSLLPLVARAQNLNVLKNGGFELSTFNAQATAAGYGLIDGSFASDPRRATVPNWTWTSDPGVPLNQGGSYASTFMAYRSVGVPEGSTAGMFGAGSYNGGGSIHQRFAATPGSTYRVTYWVQRVGSGEAIGGTVTIRNNANGSAVASQVVNMASAPSGQWLQHTFNFVAPSNDLTVTFTDTTALGAAGSTDLAVDNFSIETLSPQSLVILGANGSPGSIEANTDYSKDGGVTWHPAYLFTGHPWGYISGTNAWLNQDPSPFVGLNERVDFRIRFYVPDSWAAAHMTYQVNADNEADILVNGNMAVHTVGGSISSGTLPPEFLVPGINTIYVRLIDYGGWVGLNYRIDIAMDTSAPIERISPPPSITSALTASGTVGSPFSYTIQATNSPTSRTASNLPSGLSVNSSNGLISGTPTAAGTYNVALTATNNFGSGNNTLVLTIGKGSATVTLGSLVHTYNGGVKSASATTNPGGLPVTFSYTGASLPPVNAGSYGVFAAVNSPHYTGFKNGTLLINKAPASISFANLVQPYNGSPKPVSVTTSPAGLATNVTYNGSASAPSAVGFYSVAATVTDPNYIGSGSATLRIADSLAPVITAPASPIVVDATSANGVAVNFSVSATDDVDGNLPVSLSHASGSVFAPGFTLVTATATDAAGNQATKSFEVRVRYVTLTVDKPVVVVNEGETATNSGLVNETSGESATVSSSLGTTWQTAPDAWQFQQVMWPGNLPIELGLDAQENLYVMTELAGVFKYDPNGNLLKNWPVGRSRGIAVDSVRNVLYTVTDGSSIQKFDLDGNLLGSFGSAGSGDGQFNVAHCVAVDAAGNLYVSDSFNSRIQVFAPDGTFLRKWGTNGTGNGQFRFNQGIRIAADGTVYVADRDNHRIQYFTANGVFLGSFGSQGSGDGQFQSPASVGIDPSGNVYVGDLFNQRVQKFTATGQFVGKFGPGTGDGELNQPHGTVFPAAGRSIYIASWANGKVVKYLTPGAWSWTHNAPLGSVGTSTVEVAATLGDGTRTVRTFELVVLDATPPTLTVPANQILEATGPAGAAATFAASATDGVTASPAIAYSHASGTVFPLGQTTVLVSATDAAGNVAEGSFTVTVRDTTNPVVTAPADLVVEATSAAGATVIYDASATDIVSGNVAVVGSPASGDVFGFGTTTVQLSATDAAGNTGTASFNVTVRDTTDPVLTLPVSPIVVEATGPSGANVSFAISANDNIDGALAVTTSHASGGLFPLGDTLVTASAQDAAGNVSTDSFTVTVVDTTAPTILMSPSATISAAINNAGFEQPFTSDHMPSISGWAMTGDAGVVYVPVLSGRYLTGVAPEGRQVAYINVGSASQTLGLTLQAGKTYTLSGYVGRRSDDPLTTGRIALVTASGVVLAQVDSNPNQAVATFARYSTAFTPNASDANLGATLKIVLTNTSGQQVNFDAISLTVGELPTSAPVDIVAEATSAAGAVVNYSTTATDIVSGAVPVSSAPASGSVFPIGSTPITLGAIDAAGNPAMATFNIIVRDTTKPVLHLPASQILEATSADGAVATFAVSASDAVGAIVSTSAVSGSVFPIGTTTVEVSAIDPAGNETNGSFTITVVDTTAPIIAALDHLVVEATGADGATVEFATTAFDIVDGEVGVSGSPASGSTFALGETLVTLTAVDTAGNVSTSTFTVTVVDTTAPVIATPADIVAEAASAAGAVVTFDLNASDLVDGVVTVSTSHAAGSEFPLGTTLVTLTATDAAGNTASSSFTVTVRDTTAPVIAAIDNQIIEATGPAGAIAQFVATASDAVGASVSYSIAPGSAFALGSTTVVVTAADAAGNTSTASFTILVRDTTAPTLFPPVGQTIEATSAAGAAATYTATALDLVSGNVPVAFSIQSGSTFPLGTTSVVVSTIDAAGNSASALFSIVVVDTTAPVITAPANLVLEATGPGGAIATFSASALDTVSGNVAVSTSKASGSLFALGTTTVTLGASDAAGNSSSASFTVTVVDTTAPTITVPEDIVIDSTTVMGATANYSATASDIVDGALTVTLSKASGTTFPIGTTVVTATVTDAAGNTATKTFNVTVRAPAAALVNQISAMNGTINGSIQQRTNHGVTLNGGAEITGELLAVGTPSTRLNGKPAFGGTVDSTGSANPSGYTITLNGNASLGKLVRRYDAIAMPTVAAPANPTGSRSVNMNKSSDSVGSWSTLKNLTLNGNVGSVTVPAGVYGNFTANGGSGFTLGVAGSTTPTVYHFQNLTLNGNSAFKVVGPVIIVVKNSINVNASMGSSANPAWLDLRISNGGLTLNGNVNVDGYVTAPSGTVTINGNSELRGGLVADKLVLNGNSELTLLRR